MSGALRPFFVPLVLIALVAAALGFVVARELAPSEGSSGAGVSVIALESTPPPTPSPTPKPSSSGDRTVRSSGGRVSNCPSGCTCESRPPNGVVILCR